MTQWSKPVEERFLLRWKFAVGDQPARIASSHQGTGDLSPLWLQSEGLRRFRTPESVVLVPVRRPVEVPERGSQVLRIAAPRATPQHFGFAR